MRHTRSNDAWARGSIELLPCPGEKINTASIVDDRLRSCKSIWVGRSSEFERDWELRCSPFPPCFCTFTRRGGWQKINYCCQPPRTPDSLPGRVFFFVH